MSQLPVPVFHHHQGQRQEAPSASLPTGTLISPAALDFHDQDLLLRAREQQSETMQVPQTAGNLISPTLILRGGSELSSSINSLPCPRGPPQVLAPPVVRAPPQFSAPPVVREHSHANDSNFPSEDHVLYLPPSQGIIEVADDSDHSSPTRTPSPSPEPPKAIPGFLEVFSGLGAFTRAMTKVGFRAVAIDWKGNKDKPVTHTQWLDLTTKACQAEFWKLVKENRVVYVHFAPPCGTSSRARELR